MRDYQIIVYFVTLFVFLILKISHITYAASVKPLKNPYMTHVYNDVRDMVNYLKAPEELEKQYDEFEDIMAGIDAEEQQLVNEMDTDKPKEMKSKPTIERRGTIRKKLDKKGEYVDKKSLKTNTEQQTSVPIKVDSNLSHTGNTVDVTDMIEDIIKLIKSVKDHAKDLVVDLDQLERHVLADDSDLERASVVSLTADRDVKEKNVSPLGKVNYDQILMTATTVSPLKNTDSMLKAWRDQIENSKTILDIAVAQALHSQSLLQAQLLNQNLNMKPIQLTDKNCKNHFTDNSQTPGRFEMNFNPKADGDSKESELLDTSLDEKVSNKAVAINGLNIDDTCFKNNVEESEVANNKPIKFKESLLKT